jgi:hypothetical protein
MSQNCNVSRKGKRLFASAQIHTSTQQRQEKGFVLTGPLDGSGGAYGGLQVPPELQRLGSIHSPTAPSSSA